MGPVRATSGLFEEILTFVVFWLYLFENRTIALIALGHGLTTIALFVYVLLTPWIKGVEPNVRISHSS